MSRTERVKSIIRHVTKQYPDYTLHECSFHTNRPCFTLLNNFNQERFHALFANQAVVWRSYTLDQSCDLPDHFHDLMILHRLLGDEYVLPFAGHFRESSGYTVAMFRQAIHLYSPVIIERDAFKRMAFGALVLFVAVSYRLGGVTPDIKHFSLVYTREHPVLCDLGSANGQKKELINGDERFDRKKWKKFLCKKKLVSLIRFLRIYFPKYFQKKKAHKRCILHEYEDAMGFDDDTHHLICGDMYLIDALQRFKHLVSDSNIRDTLIPKWVQLATFTDDDKGTNDRKALADITLCRPLTFTASICIVFLSSLSPSPCASTVFPIVTFFAIRLFRSAFAFYVRNMPPLNVPVMMSPILDNFDAHVNNFIRFLQERLHYRLIYQGPHDVRQHILQKTVYACSVYCMPKKILKDVFPVMIGSRLDLAIRHQGLESFDQPFTATDSFPFGEVDIGRGFFIINGFLRHIPYFYTNDPTNTHVIQKKLVRVYSYNAQDRGKELSYYVAGTPDRRYGQVIVVHNDGRETDEDPTFFAHCPHPVHLTAYMSHLHRQDVFDIDHLGNKMVVSPGHLFTKLFVKYLYGPLREKDWKLVKSRTALVRSSIESGCLLHVLSRKTVYFKEGKSAGKMTHDPHHESHREIGSNGEIFVEKSMGCYREVSTQTYPLNPFLLYLIVRQMSNKVNHATLDPYHPSQEGWFCKLGVFDTKNVGRMNTMVRDTIVTTCDHLDPVYHESFHALFWDMLDLEPLPPSCSSSRSCYVVVNEACIPVSQKSFDKIDLLRLKRTFIHIECYARDSFIIIRYKMGLIMKRLPETDIWVTPYDEVYWARLCFQIQDKEEMIQRWPFTYSYFVDLNPYFHHNAFLKNILAFNALKNAVLATTSKYAHYFMDSVSAYQTEPSADHKALMEPVQDGVSPYFVILLPQVVVTYMSFRGLTQEDCIVKQKDFRGFDCCRFYTLRLRVKRASLSSWVKFYPVRGDVDKESNVLGTLIGGVPLEVEPYSIHVRAHHLADNEYRLTFSKTPFRVVQHFLTEDKLMISVEQEHVCSTGDKLCSLHGQKGVIRVEEKVPILDGHVRPILIVNPYCMFRMTTGQPLEALCLGNGRDAKLVQNAKGRIMRGASALYGKTFYFVVVYFSYEHMYAPDKWVMDKVIHQPVKGRSRQGGMKLGNMEVNALRGNGVACCFEEKFFEDGDRVPVEGEPTETVPQSMCLVTGDLAFYKCHFETKSFPAVQQVK